MYSSFGSSNDIAVLDSDTSDLLYLKRNKGGKN
jgi:hypothetical protein